MYQETPARQRRPGASAARLSVTPGSAVALVDGASTSGPAPRSTISSTRRISCCSPCCGVCGTSSASATSPSSCSSGATRSPTRRSGVGSSASRRCLRTSSGPSGAAERASPGTSTRPTSRSRAGGATSIGPSTADGDLLDSILSAHRDKHAARRFLRRLVNVAGTKPLRVHDRCPIRPTAGRSAGSWGGRCGHRCNRYLNNLTEQSHRAVKQRYYPMLGFGSFASAARFCTAFDELRQYFRVRQRGAEWVPLATQATALRPALAVADRGDAGSIESTVGGTSRPAYPGALRSGRTVQHLLGAHQRAAHHSRSPMTYTRQ